MKPTSPATENFEDARKRMTETIVELTGEEFVGFKNWRSLEIEIQRQSAKGHGAWERS